MEKKVPLRQCLGCRAHKPKAELLRVVHTADGAVSLDFKGKLQGRGAYLCPEPKCLARVQKSRALERAFSCQLPPEVFETLALQMKEGD